MNQLNFMKKDFEKKIEKISTETEYQEIKMTIYEAERKR